MTISARLQTGKTELLRNIVGGFIQLGCPQFTPLQRSTGQKGDINHHSLFRKNRRQLRQRLTRGQFAGLQMINGPAIGLFYRQR